jgi:hypothetical protein
MLNVLASVEDNFTYYYLTDTVSRFTIFARRVPVEITEVRITLRNEEKLKAFASITFDDCFVVTRP